MIVHSLTLRVTGDPLFCRNDLNQQAVTHRVAKSVQLQNSRFVLIKLLAAPMQQYFKEEFKVRPTRINLAKRTFAKRSFAASMRWSWVAPSLLLVVSPTLIAQDRAATSGKGKAQVQATPASSSRTITEDTNAGPAVVATVNGASVSLADLAVQCKARFGDQVLDDLVNKTLILQACQAQNISISQKDIDDEIGRTASKFNLSTPMYLKLIEDERHITPEQYASDIIWPMLALRALSKDKIVVTPQEIDRAFQSEFGPKVQVRMIACKDPQKAAQIHRQVSANPSSFKSIARDQSEDPTSASVEGLLPPIRKFTGDDELESIAFSLQPDQISRVFTAGEMSIMLQCVKHLPPANPPAAQMQEIQSRIKVEMEDGKLRGGAETVYNSLRQASEVIPVYGRKELEQQYPGVAAIVNRQSIPMQRFDQACVKRHGKQILEGEINRKLIEGALAKAQLQVTQPDIDREAARAADYYGFINKDGSPNIQEWMKHVLSEDNVSMEVYVRDVIWPTVALKKLIEGSVQVSDEDLRKGFESNYGPRAEVLAIVLSNQRTAQSVWEMARGNPSEQFFGELAHQYSVEPSSKSNFGKVPPLRRWGGQPNLEKAAFDLKPGDLSGIVEIGGQYVILKCQGQTTPVVTDFNAVRGELMKDILEKKQRVAMDAHLTKLIADAQVVNYLSQKARAGVAETQAAMEALRQETKTR
jgi:parvulin-like peptidyl-prolyl isomerase